MPDYVKLSAEPRTVLGKKVKRLRREGKLPAVVYGPVIDEAQSVQVDWKEFEQTFKEVGYTSLIDLTVNGSGQPVFVREVQLHPVRRDILHIDFYAPNMKEPVDATVPVHTVGEIDDSVEAELTLGLFEVTVRALPDLIPNEIQADVSGLKEIGDQIIVADLPVPEGVEIITSEEELIAKLDPIREEEIEEEVEEVEEGEEPEVIGEEGEEAAEESGESEEEE
jgi:large subunit ribosomal protein L25